MSQLPESLAECHERIRSLESERDGYKRLVTRLWRAVQDLLARFVHDSEQRARLEQQLLGHGGEEGEVAAETEAEVGEEPAAAGPFEGKERRRRRPRGQRRHGPGHGRRDYSQLPTIDVPFDEGSPPCCECCGTPRRLVSIEYAFQLLWHVAFDRRRFGRGRWALSCGCEGVPPIITDPLQPKPIPKSLLATETLVNLFIHRFQAGLPLTRVLGLMESTCGVAIAAGTAVSNFYHLYLLLLPLVERIRAYNGLFEKRLRADETAWLTFFLQDMRSWIWIFVGEKTTAFTIQPSRSAEVVAEHLNVNLERLVETAETARKLILGADSFSAYTRLCRLLPWVTHSGCWAHARRPLAALLNGEAAYFNSRVREGARQWVDLIATCYKLHRAWLDTETGSQEEAEAHRLLMEHVNGMDVLRQEQLADPTLHRQLRPALASLGRRWSSLMVPLRPEHKGLSLDNNISERGLRHPVLTRKGSYGSQADWAAVFVAMAWTVIFTLQQHRLNLHQYLTSYLEACAANGGRPPQDLGPWLPWEEELGCEQQEQLRSLAAKAVAQAPRRKERERGAPSAADQPTGADQPATSPSSTPAGRSTPPPARSCPRRGHRPAVQLSKRDQALLDRTLAGFDSS